MITFLKYIHLAFILMAVGLFIFAFAQQFLRGELRPAKAKKILLHTHLTIFLLGGLLIWAKQINPFIEQGFWLIEKLGAFIAYNVMVFVALNKETRKGLQVLAFLGAFGWLIYIMVLTDSKQAILLLG
jgi:uncharacterized membrane protein SirB2